MQAFGALVEARVAHHADLGDRSGHIGDPDAHLQRRRLVGTCG
ncbi:hypothetical protein N806_29005 [Rhodococcus sp. P27]|nr:hypothetical protein N806_29005 [Rhodococcus sp. P27]